MAASKCLSPQWAWITVLLGLFYISLQCDARAVNVSNTWTMPQEGLNVFYRFFRDRISWFEADAVCQFHHANLVTVDNSFQFDATRDLLRELDVNDIVWIGLMRPQNSERFMWSNSRALVADTGYWAESLPLMDSPLCAVIDPIRDYRWHALRCGGPETASFLCEMPVPSWADACILKDMPNLTMQYMADTASIELIRNCQEEGLLRQSCKGKQDRERAIRELICPRERLEAQRINDIANSHFKSLQIINSIRTDNTENNDIELFPMSRGYDINSDFPEQYATEKNTVQRLIEQFNVDELMQADEPNYKVTLTADVAKPLKKIAKKVISNSEYAKKEKPMKFAALPIKKQEQMPLNLEDMMLGDQPQGEPELPAPVPDNMASNEIMEPLPHKKKILPQDLKTMAPIAESAEQLTPQHPTKTVAKVSEAAEVITITTVAATSTVMPTTSSTTTATTSTTTDTMPSSSSSSSMAPSISSSTTVINMPVSSSSVSSDADAFTLTTTVGSEKIIAATQDNAAVVSSSSSVVTTMPIVTSATHPIHPQQQHGNNLNAETTHQHAKESVDNSHFVPPMLLVKSHYVPPAKHEHNAAVTQHAQQHVESIAVEQKQQQQQQEHSTANAKILDAANAVANELNAAAIKNNTKLQQHLAETTTSTTTTLAISTTAKMTTDAAIVSTSSVKNLPLEKPSTTESAMKITNSEEATTEKAMNLQTIGLEQKTLQSTTDHAVKQIVTATSATTTSTEAATTTAAATAEAAATAGKQETIIIATTDAPSSTTTSKTTTTATTTTTAEPSSSTTTSTTTTTAAPSSTTTIINNNSNAPLTTTTEIATPMETSTHNFLKEETEAPFKPNRRRSLTKPETVSYFKKILG